MGTLVGCCVSVGVKAWIARGCIDPAMVIAVGVDDVVSVGKAIKNPRDGVGWMH